MPELGHEMHNLVRRLFPICRSITGDGVRQTLQILSEVVPLIIKEVPSGTKVFDWVIPDEWNINDAYVKDAEGNRVIDFKKSNLHIVNYSVPFVGTLSLEELREHLHTLPDQPRLIPSVTSYYTKKWGFCLAHNEYEKLEEGNYEVRIDSILEPGSLTYGELFIEGEIDTEILLSTYICHPSMANNELSGPVVAAYIAKHLLTNGKTPYYSYRVLFIPERIGSLTYLHFNLEHLKRKVSGGYVITCVGDPGVFSYLKTRQGNSLVDRVSVHVLKHMSSDFRIYDFLDRGSDEIQYNYPGIDLNVGSLMRTKYDEYSEYHTSGDDLDFVTPEGLEGSLEMYKCCLNVFENNRIYVNTLLCEPQLSKRGLISGLSKKGAQSIQTQRLIMNILAYCDGNHDLLSIADKMEKPIWALFPVAKKLLKHKLTRIVPSIGTEFSKMR